MATLFRVDTGEEIGHLTQPDLERLLEIVEEKGEEAESEFAIDDEVIDLLEEQGTRAAIVDMLREALGDADTLLVGYEED